MKHANKIETLIASGVIVFGESVIGDWLSCLPDEDLYALISDFKDTIDNKALDEEKAVDVTACVIMMWSVELGELDSLEHFDKIGGLSKIKEVYSFLLMEKDRRLGRVFIEGRVSLIGKTKFESQIIN